MNVTFAVFTLLLVVEWDAAVNYCETGCFAKSKTQGYTSISAGPVLFLEDRIGNEVYIRRDTGHMAGPLEAIYGLSITDTVDVWAGIGYGYQLPLNLDNVFVEMHTMSGLYLNGSGPDLGGLIEFRSGIEIGYEANNGIRFGVSLDHRSNANIYGLNPGLETLQFRVSVPTN